MPQPLSDIECRIVGALIEKQLTTPEYYPLTLNALTAACNQKNNRDPVVSYDEREIAAALEELRERNLVYVFYGSTSRVPKYKHMLPAVYELEPSDVAVLCVMMLRGPQTLGELRERTGRIYQFEGLGEVQETLDALARRHEPLVVRLERQPGQKEARFAHLLSGTVDVEAFATAQASRPVRRVDPDRLEAFENEVASLRAEVAALNEKFEEFRKQFE
jgi:uncharacterized protein YceH (UPF0502 family)